MALAIVFGVASLCAGQLFIRTRGGVGVGLAVPVGLALMTVVATWLGIFHVARPVPGLALVALVLAGLVLAVKQRGRLLGEFRAFFEKHPLALVLLIAALLVPCVAMGIAFAHVQAPLSPHDGAFHVETSDAFRQAAAVSDWYPPGLAALFGAFLQITPWIDTAAGGAWLGMGLTLLAPLVVFGLGLAVWRNAVAASAGALLVSLTHLFPYYPQIWSGWPQLLGILLVLGIWVVGLRYLEEPSWRWAAIAGVLVGAIVLVHGTELYTTAIVLLVVCVGQWRRVNWRRLVPHGVGAVVLAIVCAGPYLPVLLHWASGGGAYQVGYEDGTALEQGATGSAAQLLGLFSLDALGVDFPIRIVLVGLGLVWAVRCSAGLTVVAITSVFVGLAVVATFLNGVPLVRSVFAATYPWSLPYRHLTFASVGFGLIGGYGCLLLMRLWTSLRSRFRGVRAQRLTLRLGRLLVVTWLLLATWALGVFLAIEAGGDVSFTADDAAAMAWLSAHVAPDDIVVNDTFADAGIWAPYKAGVRIMFYRSFDDAATASARSLVLSNIAQLDQVPTAADAVCSLRARYVYYGAANAAWQVRSFPPVAELRASTALETAFQQSGATVFRIRLNC
jgi:uncharacterized protein DUF6541